MKNLISVLVVGMMGCMVWSENPTHHYDLFISDDFSESQSTAIIDAATEWQTKLGGFITFSGTSFDGGPDTISVYAVSSLAQLEQDCGSGSSTIGCEWDEGIPSRIYIPLTLTGQVFDTTAKHELGHSLGAVHIAPGNVMCKDTGCASPFIQCGDVQEIAKEWGHSFNANALPICQGQ